MTPTFSYLWGYSSLFKGWREMAKNVLAEDPDSNPSTHVMGSQPSGTPVPGALSPLLAGIHSYSTQTKYPYK